MGGVVDGQAVSAAITNPAYIFKNEDDEMPKKLSLTNEEPESGASIVNLQRAVNQALAVVGSDGEDDAAANVYATEHRLIDGLNRKEALEALDEAFDPDPEGPGHIHDGTAGQGRQIDADHVTFQNEVSGLEAATAGQAIDELAAMIAALPLQAEVLQDLQNNLVNEPIVDLVFNPVLVRTVFAKFDIVRKSDTALSEVREFGEIVFFYSAEEELWKIAGPAPHFWAPDGSAAENSGVTFSIDTVEEPYGPGTAKFGKVKVSTTEITGDNYFGRANFRVTEISQA
jgi:hypothetical protein